MIIQLVDIFYPNVFKRYSIKYNIFRDLHEKDLLGLEIRAINSKLAGRVKKIILSNKEICYSSKNNNSVEDVLVLGSFAVFKELAKEIIAIGNEDLGFKISRVIQNITEYENRSFNIGGNEYPLNNSYVMGIVNVTPDSFSDGGKFLLKDKAVEHALNLIEDGADFIDIGGESTRPGAQSVSPQEEINRVIPVLEEVIKIKPKTVISVDTSKPEVAEMALSNGAKIVNDISSAENFLMLDVVKKYNAALVLMHMKGTPANMQNDPFYEDVVSEIYDFLIDKCELAKKSGIKNVIIDPGIGFGKRVFDNYEIIKRLNEFKGIGCPILAGISRKSFLGKPLKLDVDDRETPTLAVETIAIKNGARIIRTHDVKKAIIASKINSFIENPERLINV